MADRTAFKPTQTIRALRNVDDVSWLSQASLGLGTFRWYILALLAVCILALIVTHIIVLSDLQKYLPVAGLQNIDNITIANLVFISFLIVATIGLFWSANNLFLTVKRDLSVNPDTTVFQDPVLDDLQKRVANRPKPPVPGTQVSSSTLTNYVEAIKRNNPNLSDEVYNRLKERSRGY